MQFSTPLTAAYVSVLVSTGILWSLVLISGGVPVAKSSAWLLFIAAGLIQLATRLCSFTGVARLGASPTSTLQATNPLVSTGLAVLLLDEPLTFPLLSGIVAIVGGIVLISWHPQQLSGYRWWYFLFPAGAAITAGVNHPLRRYALMISHEPLLLAATMVLSSLVPMSGYFLATPATRSGLRFHPRAAMYFSLTGVLEALGLWALVKALGIGHVVVVAPIVATAPLWVVLGTVLFSRDIEQVNLRTFAAAFFVVAGVVTISTIG